MYINSMGHNVAQHTRHTACSSSANRRHYVYARTEWRKQKENLCSETHTWFTHTWYSYYEAHAVRTISHCTVYRPKYYLRGTHMCPSDEWMFKIDFDSIKMLIWFHCDNFGTIWPRWFGLIGFHVRRLRSSRAGMVVMLTGCHCHYIRTAISISIRAILIHSSVCEGFFLIVKTTQRMKRV